MIDYHQSEGEGCHYGYSEALKGLSTTRLGPAVGEKTTHHLGLCTSRHLGKIGWCDVAPVAGSSTYDQMDFFHMRSFGHEKVVKPQKDH